MIEGEKKMNDIQVGKKKRAPRLPGGGGEKGSTEKEGEMSLQEKEYQMSCFFPRKRLQPDGANPGTGNSCQEFILPLGGNGFTKNNGTRVSHRGEKPLRKKVSSFKGKKVCSKSKKESLSQKGRKVQVVRGDANNFRKGQH